MPLLVGVAPFGLVTGVTLVAAGIPPLESMAMSIFVYAGATMLAAAQLFADGAPLAVLIFAAVVLNLRLVLYSASIRQHFAGLPVGHRALAAYLLGDNTYAQSIAHFSRDSTHGAGDALAKLSYFLGISIPVWGVWQVAVAAGIALGARLPAGWKLDFAAPLVFIAATVPLLRDRAMAIAAASAALTSVLAHELPFKLNLPLAAAAGIVAGALAGRGKEARAA
ncbi:MAG TPA: AzlC family ABC transporter permease [Burkholderiales bacterium]|nr:AzlC family ABC transporter permease [Burkholderiales bacterium]